MTGKSIYDVVELCLSFLKFLSLCIRVTGLRDKLVRLSLVLEATFTCLNIYSQIICSQLPFAIANSFSNITSCLILQANTVSYIFTLVCLA